MMSLIDKAIVDAKNIKELANKSAELKLLEKLEPVKKTIAQKLLEQEDFGLDDEEMEELPMDDIMGDIEGEMGGLNPEEEGFVGEIPQAATDGEKLCTCAGEDETGKGEEVTVTLDKLVDLAEQELKKSLKAEKDLLETMTGGEVDTDEEVDVDPVDETLKEEDEVVSLTLGKLTEIVSAITEELVFNYKFQPTGHIGRPNDIEVGEFEELQKVMAALEESVERLNGEKSGLVEKYNSLKEKYNKLHTKATEKLKEATEELKESRGTIKRETREVEELKLENVKLTAINKVLTNKKLNEKQKGNIVSVIKDSMTVREVKMNFNTAMKLVENVDAKRNLSNRRGRVSKATLSEIKATMSKKGNIVESSNTKKESSNSILGPNERTLRMAGIQLDD